LYAHLVSEQMAPARRARARERHTERERETGERETHTQRERNGGERDRKIEREEGGDRERERRTDMRYWVLPPGSSSAGS